MNLAGLIRSFSNTIPLNKANLQEFTGGRQRPNQLKLQQRQLQPVMDRQRPGNGNAPPAVRVANIEVTADRKYMYCKGCLLSQGSGSKSNVIVAVEWLDKDQQALNTDWKRIAVDLEGNAVPLLPDRMRPFVVKAPLDRRVKWVKAYAFCGDR
jgi:hypothetical protein